MAVALRAADVAAEAVRELNHATLDPSTVTATDVYESLGSLSLLTARLPQALRQLDAAIAVQADLGNLRVDSSADGPIATVIERAVRDAIAHLVDAQAAIDGAHQAASHIWFDDGSDD